MLHERGVVVQTKSRRFTDLRCGCCIPLPKLRKFNTSVLVAKLNGGVFYMFKSSAKALKSLPTMATAAMMVALFVVLYTVKIPLALESRVSLTFIPVAVSAYLLGPVPAMIVGGIGDILGCMLFPSGPYFPGFTISAMLSGLIYGVFFYRHTDKIKLRIILAKLVIILFVNIGLNTLWLSIMYHKAFMFYLAARAAKNIIVFPFQVIVMMIVVDILNRTGITKKYF